MKTEENIAEPSNIKNVLPRFELPLTEEQIEELKSYHPFNGESVHDGVDIYGRALQYVSDLVQ